MSSHHARFQTGYAIVAALFFLSGLTSLIYQVIWTRYLVFVFGSTTFATATVLSVFMGGLALGSFAAGRLADKIERPFFAYGILEAVIGIWALFVPALFDAALPVYKSAWQAYHLSLIPFSLIRFAVAAAILLVPTTCMGATLPLLARFVTRSLTVVGSRVGSLYSINTLGAVIGAGAAGFFLLPTFGIHITTLTAAAGNGLLFLAVAATARKLDQQDDASTEPDTTTDTTVAAAPEPQSTTPVSNRLLALAVLVFAISGGLSMIYEVAWTRTLLMVIGSTTYAFTIMLSSFLIGIVGGSYLAAHYVDRLKNPLAWFAGLQFLICLAALISTALFNLVPYWNLTATAATAHQPEASMILRFLFSAAMLMPITLCLGATFPIIVKACARDITQIGRSVGSIYAANTLGAIIGSFLAGFVIIPVTGAEKALVLASMGNLACGAILLAALPDIKKSIRVIALAACLAIGGLKLSQPDTWNHLLLLSAQMERRLILFTPSAVKDVISFDRWRQAVESTTELLFWRDGACANVGVVRARFSGLTSLLTNGHVDASDGSDMPNQLLLSALPLLVNEQATNAAVVGWGSGVTVGAATLFPLKSIKAIEIEPAVLDAARSFDAVNYQPQRNANVHAELNDGRNYLLASDELFDVIISEPSNPWQAGVCNLFTKEFFAICKQRLARKGILAMWLQLNEISPDNVHSVLSALHSIFPYTLPIQSHEGDSIVLASSEPLTISYERARAVIEDPHLQPMFKRAGIGDAGILLSRILATPQAVAEFTKDVAPNTDDRNRLEYEVARTYENRFFTINNLRYFAQHGGNPASVVDWGEVQESTRFAAMRRAAAHALAENKPLVCIQWARAAIAVKPTPRCWQLIGESYLSMGEHKEAEEAFAEALKIAPGHIPSLLAMALEHKRQGDVMAARTLVQKAFEKNATNPLVRYRLAQTYMPSVRGILAHTPVHPIADEPKQVLELIGSMRDKPPVKSDFGQDFSDLNRLLAVAEFQVNPSQKAVDRLREYLKEQPTNINAWLDLAHMLSELGDHASADGARARAESLREDLVKELLQRGRTLLRRSRVNQARELLQQARSVDPDNLDVKAALSDLAKQQSQ